MAGNYYVTIEGLGVLSEFEKIPAEIRRAAVRAVNSTAERGRPAASRQMRAQIRFPASYLSGQNGRLEVSKRASTNSMSATITGRQRPTSLARFSTGSPRRGVRVGVKAGGKTALLRRAFLIHLRSGSDSLNNVGLAIRTSGEKPKGAYKPKQLGKNLWLLYGPSVDQVFRTVSEDIAPELAEFLEAEFLRLASLPK